MILHFRWDQNKKSIPTTTTKKEKKKAAVS